MPMHFHIVRCHSMSFCRGHEQALEGTWRRHRAQGVDEGTGIPALAPADRSEEPPQLSLHGPASLRRLILEGSK
jgi:hypothetical protein